MAFGGIRGTAHAIRPAFLTTLPSNFPWSGGDWDLPAFKAFDVDELVTEHARFPLQIRQHPVTVLLFINLLARIHRGRTIAQHALILQL